MNNRDHCRIRVLSATDAQELTPEQRRWVRAIGRKQGLLLPIAGGDGEEGSAGGSGEGESEGEGSGSGESGSSGGEEGSGEGEGSGSGSGSSEEDEDEDGSSGENDNDISLRRSEYERLKRIAREQERDKKRRDNEQKKADEKRRKEQGEYEELLAEKDEQIKNTEAERDEARYQLDSFKRRVRVTEAAKRLGFKDPEDAFRFLTDEDTEDDTTTERALKRLAKSKSYLVVERRPTGAPVNGDGATLTLDQIKNMSTDEINKNWDQVQKAMASAQ